MIYCHKKINPHISAFFYLLRYSSNVIVVVKVKTQTSASLEDENNQEIEKPKVNKWESGKKQKEVTTKHMAPKKHVGKKLHEC